MNSTVTVPQMAQTMKSNTTTIARLPDGSGCFTAEIMSKQEAMALPLKYRPLNHRISSEMYHAVFEAIGEASMCWNPRPSSEVFATEQASDVAVRLCFKIADELEARNAPSVEPKRPKSDSVSEFPKPD